MAHKEQFLISRSGNGTYRLRKRPESLKEWSKGSYGMRGCYMSRKQGSTILSSPDQQGKGKHQPTSSVGQQYFPLFFGGSYSTVQGF